MPNSLGCVMHMPTQVINRSTSRGCRRFNRSLLPRLRWYFGTFRLSIIPLQYSWTLLY